MSFIKTLQQLLKLLLRVLFKMPEKPGVNHGWGKTEFSFLADRLL